MIDATAIRNPQEVQRDRAAQEAFTPISPIGAAWTAAQAKRGLSGYGNPETGEDISDEYKHCYWRKMPSRLGPRNADDGWIYVGGGCPTDFKNNHKLRREPLDQYGVFHLIQPGYDLNKDPYCIILAAGGAPEFTLDQITELGWHLRPPTILLADGRRATVNFPQLADWDGEAELTTESGVVVGKHECSHCQRVFRTPMDLAKHEVVMHSEASSNQALARNIASANAGLTGPMGDVLQQVAATLAQVQQAGGGGDQTERLLALIERQEAMIAESNRLNAELIAAFAPRRAGEPLVDVPVGVAPERKPQVGDGERRGPFGRPLAQPQPAGVGK